MVHIHRCSDVCGTGSTTISAKEIALLENMKLRLRIAEPPSQDRYSWSFGKRAMVNSGTQVDDKTAPKVGCASRAAGNRRSTDKEASWRTYGILRVHETGTDRGLGVFAGQDLLNGQRIINELPLFSCIHWNKGRRTAAEEWLKLGHAHREDMRFWFRKIKDVALGGNDSFETRDRKRLEKFITDYAFADPQREKAHIYRLASTMNHACRSCANAQFWVDSQSPNRISVRLVRDVRRDDEILICYNRSNLKFGCAICRSRHPPRNGIWASITKVWKRRQKAVSSGNELIEGKCKYKDKGKGKGKGKTVRFAKPAEDTMSTISEELT